MSEIEWTDQTWNPITGCSKISPGCENCYAERFANRLKSMLDSGNQYKNSVDSNGHWTGEITCVESSLKKPFHWQKPRRVFVNSMSDMFHPQVPLDFIKKIFEVMNKCDQHLFQVLTKRAKRMAKLSTEFEWTKQIWAGVSIENNDFIERIDKLREVPSKIKFISFEPLLGPVKDLNIEGIDWVIVGGESGNGARPMDPEWVLDIFEECQKQNVSFFFKQWGAYGPDGKKRSKKENGREFKGEVWNEFPMEHRDLISA